MNIFMYIGFALLIGAICELINHYKKALSYYI